jgi:hypothetical protein
MGCCREIALDSMASAIPFSKGCAMKVSEFLGTGIRHATVFALKLVHLLFVGSIGFALKSTSLQNSLGESCDRIGHLDLNFREDQS